MKPQVIKTTLKPKCPHCRGAGYDNEFTQDNQWISQPCDFCGGTGSASEITLMVAAFGDIPTVHTA